MSVKVFVLGESIFFRKTAVMG